MKASVRTLVAQVDDPTFVFKAKPFWKYGDYEVPDIFRLVITSHPYAWSVVFVAPAWMLLASPCDYPAWRKIPKWPEVFNIIEQGAAPSMAVPKYAELEPRQKPVGFCDACGAVVSDADACGNCESCVRT